MFGTSILAKAAKRIEDSREESGPEKFELSSTQHLLVDVTRLVAGARRPVGLGLRQKQAALSCLDTVGLVCWNMGKYIMDGACQLWVYVSYIHIVYT